MAGKSINWKYDIGHNILDSNRNMTIIDREPVSCNYKNDNKEYIYYYQNYKYHCNICGFEGWVLLSNLNKGSRCSCCSNRTVVKGINDIGTLRPDLFKYFVNTNDAYTHTVSSGQKVECKCPICGSKKYISISNLSQHGFSCSRCSDGVSYPEKFMMSILSQLNVEYKFQLTNKTFNWCGKYKYDFYLPKYNVIIETHGEQHYNNVFLKTTLKEVQENDAIKKNIALQNNISDYIVINCSKSTLDYIKNSIYNTAFFVNNFNLDDINWELCHRESLRNKLIEVCEYWKEHYDESSVSDISKKFNIATTTVLKYLHTGTDIGLCYYDKSISYKKAGEKRRGENNPNYGKKVTEEKRQELLRYAIKYGMEKAKKICQLDYSTLELIEVHPSINSLKKKFGYATSSISACCKGDRKSAYGYKWRYYEDYFNNCKTDNVINNNMSD